MALVRLKNGQMRSVPHDKAVVMWRVFNGELHGSPGQTKFIKQVDRIFLNWRNAPISYLKRYRDSIKPLAREHGVNIDDKIQPQELWYKIYDR